MGDAMTFDEWANNNWHFVDVRENARAIWEAATLAEREACAKTCEGLICTNKYPNITVHYIGCASAIRERSDSKVVNE